MKQYILTPLLCVSLSLMSMDREPATMVERGARNLLGFLSAIPVLIVAHDVMSKEAPSSPILLGSIFVSSICLRSMAMVMDDLARLKAERQSNPDIF